MIKVLHLNGARGWGGNEQQLIDQIESPLENVRHYVYCLSQSGISEKLRGLNQIEVVHSRDRKYKSSKNRKHLSSIINEFNIDILHIHTSNALTLFFFTSLFYSVKCKVVFSKKGMGSSMSILSKFKYNYSGIDVIICVSNYVKKAMEDEVLWRKNRKKLLVVPDGVSLNRADAALIESRKLHKNSRRIQILNVANHTNAKDLFTLIESIRVLVQELGFKDFYLHQIGSYTKLTDQLRDLINKYDLQNYIKLYGFMDEGISIMNEADLLVVTSKKEGGPSSVIEAMSQRLPIVTTKVGVVYDLLEHLKDAFVVSVGDYKSIAEGIYKISHSEELRSQFSNYAHEKYLNNYTASQTSKMISEIYRKVLSL